MHYYVDVLKKYAVFSGRAGRKEYWLFILFNFIISVVLDVLMFFSFTIGVILSAATHTGEGIVFALLIDVIAWLYFLAIIIPSLSVATRRLHDTNRSGWWLLIGFVPVVGGIILLVFLVLGSQPGENKYGPNPKEVEETSGKQNKVIAAIAVAVFAIAVGAIIAYARLTLLPQLSQPVRNNMTLQTTVPTPINSSPISPSKNATTSLPTAATVSQTPRASSSAAQLNQSNSVPPYDAFIKNLVSSGWKKATFVPDPGNHGTSFTFYYPPNLVATNSDKLVPAGTDAIADPVKFGNGTAFDQVAQLFSSGFNSSIDDAIQQTVAFPSGPIATTSFTTASGLNGEKITASQSLPDGTSFKNDVILLHTGKQSDMGNEIIIGINGSYGYSGGSGHGQYAGSSDIIDQIAKTISL